MAKAIERLDDARRQGQFEGQVLTSLADIKKGMDAFNTSLSGIESRVRINEKIVSHHDQLFIDSNGVHDELFKLIKEQGTVLQSLVVYQERTRGVILVVMLIMPVILTIVSSLILKAASNWLSN